jgi:succinate dehydrogenase / fumarate reductase membrane anchor subunit
MPNIKPDLRNPLKRARHVGSAKSGAADWVGMQFTSILLVPLTIWFIMLVLDLMHSSYPAARHAVGHPMNATLMVAFLLLTGWHMELGVRNIVDDYVKTHWLKYWSVLLMRTVIGFSVLLAVMAIVRITLTR